MDGDYKHWDQTTSRELRAHAFDVLGMVFKSHLKITDNEWAYLTACCLDASVQIGHFRFKGDLGTLSGDPFTTIVNNTLNELVHMFAFYKLNPGSDYFSSIRLKVGGDDNLSCPVPGVVWNPLAFGGAVKALGLQYWPVDKEASALGDELVDFENVTFLGARPVNYQGMWAGALNKESLFEGLHWMDSDTLQLTVNTYLELASVHGNMFYEDFYNVIVKALVAEGLETHFMPTYEEVVNPRVGYVPPLNRATWEDFLPTNQGQPTQQAITDAVIRGVLDNAVGRWAAKYGYLQHLVDLIDHRAKVRKVYEALRPYLIDVSEEQIDSHDLSKCNLIEIIGYSYKFFKTNNECLKVVTDEEAQRRWVEARDHHFRSNPHHAQYWSKLQRGDAVPFGVLEEVVVDQLAARWRRHPEETEFNVDSIYEIDYSVFANLPKSQRKLRVIVDTIQRSMKPMVCTSSGAPVGDVSKYVTPGRDLTKIQQQGVVNNLRSMGSGVLSRDNFSIPKMDLDFGLESKVLRKVVDWTTAQPKGTKLFSVSVPAGILKLGNQRNLQNMAFDNFMFWRGNVKMTIKVNGTPFQQGMLVGAFTNNAEDFSSSSVDQVFRKSHVKIFPAHNSLVEFEIPFRYFRARWNTTIRDTSLWNSIGVFTIWVYAALVSKTETDVVQVSISSSFPDAELTLPRPGGQMIGTGPDPSAIARGVQQVVSVIKAADAVANAVQAFLPAAPSVADYKIPARPLPGVVVPTRVFDPDSKMVGTGASYSTYNIGEVMGSVPVQNYNTGVDARPMMDNPPVASGSLPVQQQFSGMSKALGPEPTVSMQLAPHAMARTCPDTFGINQSEMDMDFLASRQNFVAIVPWKVKQDRETPLLRMALGPHRPADAVLDGTFVPQWEIFDLVTFWHADIVLSLTVVKTNMHSGSLLVSIGYGAHEPPRAADATTYFNQILDFSGACNEGVVRIPYQAATDWLYVYNGFNAYNEHQDQHFGWLSVFIQNSLVGPSTVSDSVSVLVLLHFENARFAVPRTQRWFSAFNADLHKPSKLTVADMRARFVTNAQAYGADLGSKLTAVEFDTDSRGLTTSIVKKGTETFSITKMVGTAGGASLGERPTGSAESPDERGVAAPEVSNIPRAKAPLTRPEGVVLGQQLEFSVTNLADILRRYRLKAVIIDGKVQGLDEVVAHVVYGQRETCITVPVFPENWPGADWFASWKGTIKYRIFSYCKSEGHQGFSVRLHLFNYNEYERAASYTVFGDGNYRISDDIEATLQFTGSSPALEESYPLTGNRHFLDVSVPFQNIYNWLHAKGYRAKLVINFDTKPGTEIHIFDCAGDDFAFGNYIGCPKTGLTGPYVRATGITVPDTLSLNGMMLVNKNIARK